jgi:CheY-like chemotaxis protein
MFKIIRPMTKAKPLKILVIDDDYLDIESLRRSLSKLKIDEELFVAHNGVDALALLMESSDDKPKLTPDVILLDLNMPKMNGFEFLRIIKNYFTLAQIKIFVLSTSFEDYDKMTARTLDVDGYIQKPLDFSKRKSMKDVHKLYEILVQ